MSGFPLFYFSSGRILIFYIVLHPLESRSLGAALYFFTRGGYDFRYRSIFSLLTFHPEG